MAYRGNPGGVRALGAGGVLASLIALALASGGCAARSPAAAGAAAPGSPTPTTIEEAQMDIERWRGVLDPSVKFATPPPASTGTATSPPYPEPGPAPTQPPTPRMPDSEAVVTGTTSQECGMKCRAIASMRRSVGVLCGLSGDADARCVDARGKLEDSERRVASCGC